eukprot:GILI01003698.1.p1 GENE.GILI01003698.1~~GILI01003698.1.p1  ORF type:complete len:606 (+),score=161.45 GILI01003698.1:144-1961(+)
MASNVAPPIFISRPISQEYLDDLGMPELGYLTTVPLTCSFLVHEALQTLPPGNSLSPGEVEQLFTFEEPESSPEGTCSFTLKAKEKKFNIVEDGYGLPFSVKKYAFTDNPTTRRLWQLNRLIDNLVNLMGPELHWVGIYRLVLNEKGAPQLVKEAYRGEISRGIFPATEEFSRRSNNSFTAVFGKGCVIPDTHNLGTSARYYQCSKKVRSECCLPIRTSDGRVLGIIDAESFTPSFFTPERTMELLRICTDLADCNMLLAASEEPVVLTPLKQPLHVLGSMTFGQQVTEEKAGEMLDLFMAKGRERGIQVPEIDTAFLYCEGVTEQILGNLLPKYDRSSYFLATKVHPWKVGSYVSGWDKYGLSKERIHAQFFESLDRLKLSYVDLLYLHAPSPCVPLEESVKAVGELIAQGKVKSWGMSNFPAWMVAQAHLIAAQNGMPGPTHYQGMYNAITRDIERELFPCLKSFGMHFRGYNPLAGGLLTGKYSDKDHLPGDGRFHNNATYQSRFWTEAHFAALKVIREACEEFSLDMTSVALRWLVFHSPLVHVNRDSSTTHGVILGASSIAHLESNLSAWATEPLPPPVLNALDRAWELARPSCEKYFRP